MIGFSIPDSYYDPPEDTRRHAFCCEICGEWILEGDDYYDIRGLGPCCEECIDDARRFDAECE